MGQAMLVAAVLSLLLLGSVALSAWAMRKLHSLKRAGSGPWSFRPGILALFVAVVVLLAGMTLTWRSGLAGRAAIEFFVAYAAVAYPLMLWIGFLLMRNGRPRPK